MTSVLRQRAAEAEKLGDTPLLSTGGTEHERLGALDALRAICAVPFDKDDPSHLRTLKDIWYSAFPDETFTLPSERWKDIGFQGTDPTTDLRGAGYMGLTHLQALLAEHGLGLGNLADELPPDLRALPLSIASVNVTAMLLSYLQLAPKLTCAFLPGGRLECDAKTLQAFLSLGWEGGSLDEAEPADEGAAAAKRLQFALVAMHSRLVTHLASSWKAMSAAGGATLMDFPKALRETYAHMQRALKAAGAAPWRLERVTACLDAPDGGAAGGGDGSSYYEYMSEGIHECIVGPTTWALSGAASVVSYIVFNVVGLCWREAPSPPASEPKIDPQHAKRQ